MPSIRINLNQTNRIYFLTLTVNKWRYVFNNLERNHILLSSIKYCQIHKNLKVFAFVFMLNHIHLIIQSDNAIDFLRDFKKYTSFAFLKNLTTTQPEFVSLFLDRNHHFCLWEKTNMPKLVESENYYFQKKTYIENNPVKKGYVELPEQWLFSSAHKPYLLKLAEA